MLVGHSHLLGVVFITVLIPEVALLKAIQEFLGAWSLANALEAARMSANDRWEKNLDGVRTAQRKVSHSCGCILLRSELLLIFGVGTQGERIVALQIPLQLILGRPGNGKRAL